MADQAKNPGEGENQGEGNRTAAREYNEAQKKFAESGKVDAAAKDAAKAVEGKEAEDLKRADQAATRHSQGHPPAVKR
jgi:hypothetical protein